MEESKKIFRLPGTIEEDEEKELESIANPAPENLPRVDSPLLSHRSFGTLSSLPRNVTLVRVSTQSSGFGRQDSTRSRYRAGPTRKLRRRAVLKNGDCNVLQSRISRRSLRFLQDIFTTLVDTQWRWTLLCFTLSFVLSWLGFAVIWWLIAFTHGDFEEDHLPPNQIENDWKPCIYNLFSFTSCFLFSIETQHTIGYGGRATTEECPEAIFVMCIQSIAGVMIQAFMVGIVFAKMSRPKQRTQTLLFSRNAVICQRDGELCLMFRVGDMRKSHIIGATVRAQMIRTKMTKEGEILPQNQQEMQVGTDGKNENLFFIWPMTIVHRIDEDSPFYDMSAEDMLTERFEVVVILEGTIESTGQTTQARSSYLPQEILWGHRFEPMVTYSKERQGYQVDYSLFDGTTQVDTPLCSGRELAEFYKVREELRHGNGLITTEDTSTDRSSEKRTRCHCNYRHRPTLFSDHRRSHQNYIDETKSDDGPILPSRNQENERFEIPDIERRIDRENDPEIPTSAQVTVSGDSKIYQAVNRVYSASPTIERNDRYTPLETTRTREDDARSSHDMRKYLVLTYDENEIENQTNKINSQHRSSRRSNGTFEENSKNRSKRSISAIRSPTELSRSFIYDLSPESGFYEADRFDSSPEVESILRRPNNDFVDDRDYRDFHRDREVVRILSAADDFAENTFNNVSISGKKSQDTAMRTISQTNV